MPAGGDHRQQARGPVTSLLTLPRRRKLEVTESPPTPPEATEPAVEAEETLEQHRERLLARAEREDARAQAAQEASTGYRAQAAGVEDLIRRRDARLELLAQADEAEKQVAAMEEERTALVAEAESLE